MTLFIVMTFAGPGLGRSGLTIQTEILFLNSMIGSIVSGFLELKKTWRWTFYVLIWLAAVTEVLMFTIPETLPSVILLNEARRTQNPEIRDRKYPRSCRSNG
jgi:MFS transporter, DHA1 family, multidrug resistance protein